MLSSTLEICIGGFTNVEEILHTGKGASTLGIWLLAQLAAAKVVATALCKGSGLVGGLYAPSLMIGAAVGAVFGGSAAEIINRAIPGNAAVAQPQAYALVLYSLCRMPLLSAIFFKRVLVLSNSVVMNSESSRCSHFM